MPKKIEQKGPNKYKLTLYLGYDAKGKQRTRSKTVSAANLKEATKIYYTFLQESANLNPDIPQSYTVTQFFHYWRQHYSEEHLELTTQEHYLQLFKRIEPLLGSQPLTNLSPIILLNFLKELKKDGLSANSVLKYHKFLKSLLAKACKWDFISRNPCDRVDPPKKVKTEKKIYSEEDLRGFLSILDQEPLKYQLMTYLGLIGGLRKEEIFGLEWSHIEWKQQTIHIKQVAPCLQGHPGFIKKPKTETSGRSISIPDSLLWLLRRHKATQFKEASVLGDQWENSKRIFTQWNGKPAHPSCFNIWLKNVTKRRNFPHLCPHDLRHLSATYLVNSGMDITTISKRLGHSRTSTTTDIYSHLIQRSERESANRLEKIFQEMKDSA